MEECSRVPSLVTVLSPFLFVCVTLYLVCVALPNVWCACCPLCCGHLICACLLFLSVVGTCQTNTQHLETCTRASPNVPTASWGTCCEHVFCESRKLMCSPHENISTKNVLCAQKNVLTQCSSTFFLSVTTLKRADQIPDAAAGWFLATALATQILFTHLMIETLGCFPLH